MEASPIIQEKAQAILAEIEKATSVLLHCHPSPDPDSVCSALAMKFALESMGKRATVIRGDSEIPEAFAHFPGVPSIVQKAFFEVDLSAFDLFIILDSGAPQMITRFKPVTLPLPLKTIVIDHHASNPGYADLNLIEPSYPAVSQILFFLFKLWHVNITPDIAGNLFMGIYTDTGGFKYDSTTATTFAAATELAKIIPQFPKIVSDMENSLELNDLRFEALALSSIETFLEGRFGISALSLADLEKNNVPLKNVHGEMVSPLLRSVKGWAASAFMVETQPGMVKVSFRSKDAARYDVAALATALGGGGHKAAAGATLKMSIPEAKALVVAKAKELYNL